MKRDKILKIVNAVFPVIGVGLMIAYGVCDTSCSSLRGTFLGVDLKVIGILFMALLFVLSLPPVSRYVTFVDRLRTMMLASAIGGEVLLVRFQVVHDIYCPFCLAYGLCLVVLFAANFMRTNKYLALGAFLAGVLAFVLFFEGSFLPLYN
jgi:hypothetical protein